MNPLYPQLRLGRFFHGLAHAVRAGNKMKTPIHCSPRWLVAAVALGLLSSAWGNVQTADLDFQKTKAAAERGEAESQFNLGARYAAGNGVPKDAAEAVKWYRKAAEQGLASAQRELGDMYAEGRGVPRDTPEGLKWHRKAADQGDAKAQFGLGCMYARGDGVPRDAREAVKWVRKAADQGLAGAQYYLGILYDHGQGVAQDPAEAMKWLRRAAAQGDANGQFTLGVMYANGQGVPKDDVEAYTWLNLASAAGLENAARARATVARNMSREEIIEAQQRSRAFVPRRELRNDAPDADHSPSVADRSERSPQSGGTGFFVSEDGFLLSSYHVVEGADRVMVKTRTSLLTAKVVRSDAANDLALLKVPGTFKSLSIAPSRSVKLGDTVFTLGFPNVPLQGFEPKLTKGEINGLAGVQDDPRHFQISASIQPGNSGGPLVNLSGNVVGIAAGRLSDAVGLVTSGALPQNVNYALKSSYALLFLESVPELSGKLKEPKPANDRKLGSVTTEVTESVVLILAY